MTIDFFLVHLTLADGSAHCVAGCLDSDTCVITFTSKVEDNPELASCLHGAWVDTRDGEGLRVSLSDNGLLFLAESPALFEAKQLVQDNGFEVLFDEESGFHFWRARDWVKDPVVPEEYRAYMSPDEACFGCVKENDLRKISVTA